MQTIALLIRLILAHLLCDFPLQGDFLARAKDPTKPIPGIPWEVCMGAHAGIQAGGVYVVTGSLVLTAVELVLHAAIDLAKCHGVFSFKTDQMLHLCCKAAYVAVGTPHA